VNRKIESNPTLHAEAAEDLAPKSFLRGGADTSRAPLDGAASRSRPIRGTNQPTNPCINGGGSEHELRERERDR
jgi:hypothetical protein